MPAQRPVQGTRSTQGGAPRRAPQKKKRNLAARIGIGILKFIAVCMCLAIILGSVAAVLLSMYIVKATADDATLINLDDLELAYTSIVYYKNTNADGQEEWLEYQRLDSPEENRIWVDLAASARTCSMPSSPSRTSSSTPTPASTSSARCSPRSMR